MPQCKVSPNRTKLTEAEYRPIQGAILRRLELSHGQQRLALEAGTEARTIRNARDALATMRADFLFNLLDLDASALDEVLAHYGLKAVPMDVNTAADSRLLADIAGLGATFADALADGRIDHREEQTIADRARPVVRELAGRIAQADRKRAA